MGKIDTRPSRQPEVRRAKERAQKWCGILAACEELGITWPVVMLAYALSRVVADERNRQRNQAAALRSYYRDIEQSRAKARSKEAAKRAADPEAVRAIERARYQRDPSKKLASIRAYCKRHPEKVRARRTLYRKTHARQVTLYNNARRCMKRAAGKYTAADVQAQFNAQSGLCFYCATSRTSFHVEHKVPLSRGGTNWPDNIVCACAGCNLRKHTKTADEFITVLRAERELS